MQYNKFMMKFIFLRDIWLQGFDRKDKLQNAILNKDRKNHFILYNYI